MRVVFFCWREGAYGWYRFGMKLFSLFVMVTIGGMVTLGCSGSGGGGNSGGSGGGGSGAGTSAGGGGGSGAGTIISEGGGGSTSSPCTLEEGDANPVKVGFGAAAPGATDLPMVIDSVSADQLVLVDAGGQQLTFTWAGPDLTLTFTAGQSVTVDGPTGPAGNLFWHAVRSDTHVAAAFYHDGFDSAVAPPSSPLLAGLELLPADTCPPPSTESYYNPMRIQAKVGSDTALIKNHETQEVGSLQVHNSGNVEVLDASGEGEPETTHQNSVTVLGPLP